MLGVWLIVMCPSLPAGEENGNRKLKERELREKALIPIVQTPLGREEIARQTKGGKCSFLTEELWLTHSRWVRYRLNDPGLPSIYISPAMTLLSQGRGQCLYSRQGSENKWAVSLFTSGYPNYPEPSKLPSTLLFTPIKHVCSKWNLPKISAFHTVRIRATEYKVEQLFQKRHRSCNSTSLRGGSLLNGRLELVGER